MITNKKLAVILLLLVLLVLIIGLIGNFDGEKITVFQTQGSGTFGADGGSATANTMIIANKENFVVTNYPLQFGRPFVQGEVPAGFVPQVFIDGVWVQTQVDIKNRWTDGSLKFAVFSLVVSQIGSGQTRTITFQNVDEAVYQSGVGNSPMTPSEILSIFDEFDAVMELSNSGGMHSISARQMISDAVNNLNILKNWNSGPVVTSIVLADNSANAVYDVGWKQTGARLIGNLCPPNSQNPGPNYNCYYDSTDTVFYVNDASWVNLNDVLNVNDELVFVQGVDTLSNPNKITVQRGYGGLPYRHDSLEGGVFITSDVWQPLNLPADNAYKSFRPIFEVDFWPTINKYEVRFIGEIANTEKLQDLTYDVVLKTGKTIVSTKLTQTGVTQHYGSRWSRGYFEGNYVLPRVEINHNLNYLSETGFVYNYDSSIQVPDLGTSTFCTHSYNGWLNSNKDLMKLGLWSGGMGDAGNRAELGADVPCWDALWLNSMDYRAREITLGQAELAASWPVHFREGRTGKVFDRNPSTGQPGTLPGLGKVVSPNGRPTLILSDPVQYFSNYNIMSDRINFVSRFTNGEISLSIPGSFGAWKVGLGHYYNPFSISYLLTGKHFFNEEIMFWGSYTALGPSYPRGPDVNWAGQGGGLTDPYATRYQARPMVGRLWASLFAVDGTPEKELFDGLVTDAIVTWMGMQNILLSAQPEIQSTQWNQQMWQFGRDMYSLPTNLVFWVHGNPALPSPLNFWIYGNSGVCESPVNVNLAGSCESPWMISPMLADTLGKADELGYPVDKLIEFIADYFVWHFDAGSSPYTLGAYREGSVSVNNVAFNNPSEVFNAFETSYQNSPCFQQGEGCGPPSGVAQSDGYFSVAMAATARMYHIDSAPFDWFRQEAQSTYNAGVYNKDPRYAIIPRGYSPCQSNCPPNPPTNLQANLN